MLTPGIFAHVREKTSVHIYASFARMCALIFMILFLVILYYLMNLSLKFHPTLKKGSLPNIIELNIKQPNLNDSCAYYTTQSLDAHIKW